MSSNKIGLFHCKSLSYVCNFGDHIAGRDALQTHTEFDFLLFHNEEGTRINLFFFLLECNSFLNIIAEVDRSNVPTDGASDPDVHRFYYSRHGGFSRKHVGHRAVS